MRVSFQSFYSNFFGETFARHFRRIPDIDQPKIYKQFTIKNPKELYHHVHKNSGYHACFTSVYDNGTTEHLKSKNKEMILFDRLFFDFDTKDCDAERIKNNLLNLKKMGPHYEKDKQNDLKIQLQKLIKNEKIAKDAVDDAKKFSKIFKRDFGKEPALFFSGFKGCHAYVFFESFEPKEPNKTVFHFANQVRNIYALNSMDLSVNKDAVSRVARIPYSKHQLTDLTVIPFNTTDSYNEIISKSLEPVITPFNIENHSTQFNKHLQLIDQIIVDNQLTKSKKSKLQIKKFSKNYTGNDIDHRSFFKKILGEPEKEYPEKEYVMYCCPFKDHTDNKPSFMVHSKGYKCYGCGKSGNYWQFLKDYKGWDDNQVEHYLKSARTA